MDSIEGSDAARLGLAACAAVLPALTLVEPVRAAETGHLHLFHALQVEQLEQRIRNGANAVAWEAHAWIGTDDHKAWLETKGEKPNGERPEQAEFQLLYSRRISDYFDGRVGIRYDVAPSPDRGFAVLSLHGLAPYWFEVDASAFLSDEGELSARISAEYELLITQQLILQPSAEVDLAAQSVRERGIGSGLGAVELGLRLRYELVRKVAPYVGILWERKFGDTADLAREEGEDADDLSFLVGIRFFL
ncbi:MAG: hypothetical protein KatS3mg117_2055 [Geminicoccaceae bacterium]|jgi:copper resistance protein B|nr:MAG: hypothetical protein KatS3mg117_2055 [Geminicoccaceae bacterium]